MAFSGSRDYTDTYTAANVVERALARLGTMDASEGVVTVEQTDAIVALNLIIKELFIESKGNWLLQDVCVFLTDPGDKTQYSVGPSGDYAATAWYETELGAAASASDSTATLLLTDDSTHVTDNSYIGIKLDSGDIFFTDINDGAINASTANEAVTLTTAFPSAAALGSRVYVYNTSSLPSRPHRIVYASRTTLDTENSSVASSAVGGTESELDIIGLSDYFSLSRKTQTGPPTGVYYEPTLVNGTVHVWPTGDTGVDYDKIYLTTTVYPDDVDATSNNLYFPPEWHNALVWALTWELSNEYALPLQERQWLKMIADEKINRLLDYEYVGETIRLVPSAKPST